MRGRLLLGLFVLGLAVVTAAVAGVNANWSVHANGSQEVPPRDSQGQAQAIFHLAPDGQSIDYKLNAANIENVFMAHIHMVPTGPAPGVNGPIAMPARRYPTSGGAFRRCAMAPNSHASASATTMVEISGV